MLGAEEKMGVVWILNICRHGKGLGPGAGVGGGGDGEESCGASCAGEGADNLGLTKSGI